MIRRASVEATGSDGTATGNLEQEFETFGFIQAIKVTYAGTAPVGTTVVVKETGGLGQTFLTISGNTDKTYYPTPPEHDASGVETGGRALFQIEGKLRVEVSDTNVLDPAVTVDVQVMENRDIR